MFTGDFLFVGDVGRPDLLGEEARQKLAHQLYESVFGVLPALPDFTEVFPGHGAGSLCGKALGSRGSTTVGFERRYNGALQQRPESEWVSSLLEGMPIAPPYFLRMKKVNAEGPILGRAGLRTDL
jgi:hydroxyacylglutathione hydrolase